MVIKNSTPWRTEDLRKLFRRCVREVEKVEKPNYPFHRRNKNFKLDILNSGHFAGRATRGGYWMMIKIPRDVEWENENRYYVDFWGKTSCKTVLARMIIHEYYHTLGYANWDRKNYEGDQSKNWNVDWIKDYPIRKKEVVKKELIDHQLIRYQTAIKNLRKAETRMKRAKTLYKKWLNKTKYYETKCGFKTN